MCSNWQLLQLSPPTRSSRPPARPAPAIKPPNTQIKPPTDRPARPNQQCQTGPPHLQIRGRIKPSLAQKGIVKPRAQWPPGPLGL